MDDESKNKICQNLDDKLTLSFIQKIIEKFKNDYIQGRPNFNDKNKPNLIEIPKVYEKIQFLFKKEKVKKYFEINFKKFTKLVYNKNIKMKRFNDSRKEKQINKAITCISIIILTSYIKTKRHKYNQDYLKFLLLLISCNIYNLDNFVILINILLNSLLYLLHDLNQISIKKYKLQNEPLLFINDFIEVIINCRYSFLNDIKFISEFIDLFNNFFALAKNLHVFIEKDELLLKIFENKEINNNKEFYKDNKSENSPINIINNFLVNIYKNNIPKFFYNEIYKKSSIDLPYYLNVLGFLKLLYETEKDFKNWKGFKIKNGLYFLGNNLSYKNIGFNTNEFCLIFSFKINEINSSEDIIIFNLTQSGKNSIIRISIDNKKRLAISFNKDSQWNTNIIINENIFYLICLNYNKNNKVATIYINTEQKSIGKKVYIVENCFKYISKKMKNPNFSNDMSIQLGKKKNFYGILGEIILINIELDEKSIMHLFNSNEYYGDLIYGTNINNNLTRNNIYYSKSCTNSKNHFKNLVYEKYLRIVPNSFISNFKEENIFEYKVTNSLNIFLKENGIEFLIFMLHDINSQIKDNKMFNIYIYKTIDFLYNIIILFQEIKNNIIGDEFARFDSYIEIDEENLVKQLNIFFLTLFSILKKGKTDEVYTKKILSDDIRKCLINFLSLKIDKYSFHKNIIVSILFDFELFEQKKYISELNDLLKNFRMIIIKHINKDIIYKLLLFDFIFELKELKHKIYFNFFTSIFHTEYNTFFCSELINYIIKLKSEIKIYHYLKLIYYKIKTFKSIFEECNSEEKFNLFRFIEIKFETLNKDHCKYCSFIIILCYLIKDKLWNDKESNFIYNTFGYMTSPSFLFIRAIFIQCFSLSYSEKFKFIKSVNQNSYNMNFFDIIKKNPIYLCKFKIFINKFNYLIKYINFLFNQKKENLKNILDNFFPFIIEFFEKIRRKIFLNEQQNKEVNLILKEFFNSPVISNFYDLYLKYNKEKAMKSINYFIQSPIITIPIPFFFYLILPKRKIGDKNISNSIKIEIIKSLILELIHRKTKSSNIYALLILIFHNIYEEKIEISKDFPVLFVSFYCFITNDNLILERRPLDLNYFNNNPSINIDRENKKTNAKFISEIFVDIIFKFYFEDNFNNELMINSILIKENSSSIFYLNDEENINSIMNKNKIKKNVDDNLDLDIFKKEMKNFLFCLYFLIIFINKLKKYQNSNKEKVSIIRNMVETLFKDLKNIYTKNKKVISILKYVENYGPNFELYNKMLDICNKNYKESKFTVDYILKKYDLIINSYKNKELDNFENMGIEGLNEINFDKNNIIPKKYKIMRSKSYDKKITNALKEKYLENPSIGRVSFPAFNYEIEKILNQSMFIDLPINLCDDNNKKKIIKETPKSTIKENDENDLEGENYIKNKLLDNDYTDYYFQQFIQNNNDSPNIIKMLLNPKEYFLWQNFTVYFQDFLFNNKKFKCIGKLFDIHTRTVKVIQSTERDKEFFLNYPTKIKNNINDEYYRPFLKPCLNFFALNNIEKSHLYVKKDILINKIFKEDNFYSIKFNRIIPKLPNDMEEKKVFCEIMKNKGNVFGYLLLNNNYMIFINSPESDKRKSKDLNIRLDYIFSIKEDSTIDKNKYVIIFYKDIKEIIKRRICLNYIAYEIFMKDNRTYLFNFFTKHNIKEVYTFLEKVKNSSRENIKISKKNSDEKEEFRRHSDKNVIRKISINSLNKNDLVLNNYNFKIMEEPAAYFEKLDLKSKYKKGEISNFNYLLLINKYSSRTYNDYNQYLIFPLLFLDVSREKMRDLSKAICLNKDNNKETMYKCITNRQSEGFHFNQHYSTGGFILFYLVRLIPFTYYLIDFQSGKFDLPARLFNSMNNFLFFFTLTLDNRELCPEFYFEYEFLLNLNHNDFGKMEINKEVYHLNNFDSNKNEVFVEFVINLRNMLEKSDIGPWIDNIFGSKQFNTSDDHPNSFSLYTYENHNDMEKIKKSDLPLEEKINDIQERIDILKFGITPAKIFNKTHKKIIKHFNDFEDEVNNFEKKEEKLIELINDYLDKKSKEKESFYLINRNNINEIELILKFKSKIIIFKPRLKEKSFIEDKYIIKDQIDIEPYNNLFCELVPGLICIVRNKDKTIQFITKNDISLIYQWNCIVTAIEPFLQKIKTEENNNIKKCFLGDENGYLHLMEIQLEFSPYDKSYSIKSVEIKKSIKAHRTLIKGIIYNEKLNIIISWSFEGIISINNDYSFNFLNIINLKSNLDIKEIVISKYNILIVNAYNNDNKQYRVTSLTLNGIQISSIENSKNLIKCIADERILEIFSNGNILSYNCYDLYEIKADTFSDYITNYEEENFNALNINYCIYYPKIKRLLLAYNDNKISFQKIENKFLKNE